jgi:hypothetical protein
MKHYSETPEHGRGESTFAAGSGRGDSRIRRLHEIRIRVEHGAYDSAGVAAEVARRILRSGDLEDGSR